MESEKPRLTWFEVQVCPRQLRFAVVVDQPALFGYLPDGEDQVRNLFMPVPGNQDRLASLLESLDWLLQVNEIPESPQQAPEQAFKQDMMRTESVHITIAYSDGTRWSSVYPLDAVPQNVRNLVEQAKYLGLRSTEEIPPEEDDEPADAC
jgi:hypothetical protein